MQTHAYANTYLYLGIMSMSRFQIERLTQQTRIQTKPQVIFNIHLPAGGNRKNFYLLGILFTQIFANIFFCGCCCCCCCGIFHDYVLLFLNQVFVLRVVLTQKMAQQM